MVPMISRRPRGGIKGSYVIMALFLVMVVAFYLSLVVY